MTDRPVDDGALPDGTDLTVDSATADLGPEATDAQSAFVSGLLGTLRADDPPMPDDVVRRLGGVLAEERRNRLAAAGVASLPLAAATADDAGDATDRGAAPAPVTVLPERAERRGPGMRSFKVLGGVAAAVSLVAVGAVIGTSGLGGSSSGSSGGAPVVAAVGVPVADTATTYSKTALEQQARDLVGSIGTRSYSVVTPEAAAPETQQTDAAAESTAPAPPTSDDGVVTGQELAGCVAELTGRTDVTPLVVDQGTYAGRPAEVLVLPSTDEVGSLDVWVVAAGCRQGSVELFDFRRLALAVSTSPSP